MFQYIIKRILIFIPTFFVISLIIFGLSKMAPGDPIDVILSGGDQGASGNQRSDIIANEAAYALKAKELGLDKPVFYFALSSAAFPQDLYTIQKQNHRELVGRLINRYGNSEAAMDYYYRLRELKFAAVALPIDSTFYDANRFINQRVDELFFDYEDKGIRYKLDTIKAILDPYTQENVSSFKQKVDSIQEAYASLEEEATLYKLYIPNLHFYGFDNQYHTWMFGDYPWFRTVDSSNYYRVEELYQQIAVVNLQQDSLNRLRKPIQYQLDKLNAKLEANDSLDFLEEIDIDSIEMLYDELDEQVIDLDELIKPLLAKMKELAVEKDSLSKKVEIYASKGFLRGDFGKSYIDGRPVATKMGEALEWTLLMNLFAILLSYLISIPLGVQSALWRRHPKRYYPLLNLANMIGGLILVLSFYFYLSGGLSLGWHYLIIGLTNLGYFFYILTDSGGSKTKLITLESIKNFLWDLFRLRLLNIAQNSLVILRILYLWIWFFLFFIFLLQPWVVKIILISVPIAVWGIGKLRKTVESKTNNFKVSIRGLYARGSFMDNMSTTILFVLYSLPSFWIGTLLIVFFTTNQYGELYDWFPTLGVQTDTIAEDPNASWWTKSMDIMYHLFLPVFCITYGSFAYLSRQMRGAMLSVSRQDYIRTANAKGLSEKKVTWKHAFRNSLFPIITLFSSVFPRALSGAIAIELIYNIPGMGSLLLGSINERDWPMVFTIAMLASILTMLGNLIADMLYAVVDPRISFNK